GDRAHELFTLLNPLHHAPDAEAVARYKVEPYVVAADVYGAPPHVGRGGWTWYTGSAGWMYRIGLGTLLGFQLLGDRLEIEPCIPKAWPGFEITYRRGQTTYRITVDNPTGVEKGVLAVEVDGVAQADRRVPLVDDGVEHRVRAVMG